jgi:ATP-dependent RNA helicase DDX10/DBP4
MSNAERIRVGKMNILICTPGKVCLIQGRLLQHMDQSPSFDTNNLLSLILDEADLILDQGFQKTLDAIIGHLPKERQTLLYSATMTSNVEELARLSLRDPIVVNVDDTATPASLVQKYLLTSLDQKLSILKNNER